MMKLVWAVLVVALLGAAAVAAQQEASAVELVESSSHSGSSSSSSVDAGIIYDGGFLEMDADADAQADEPLSDMDQQEESDDAALIDMDDDAALIELEADSDSDAETETEVESEAETEAETEQEDSSLLEKAKKGGKAGKAGKGKAKAGKGKAKAGKAKKAGKAGKGKKAKAGKKGAKAPKGAAAAVAAAAGAAAAAFAARGGGAAAAAGGAASPAAVAAAAAAASLKAPKALREPKLEKTLAAPASDATGIVATGRGRKGRNCRGARCTRRKHGHGIAPAARRRVQQRLPSPRLTGAAATLTRANVRCVLCQFITQKLKNGLTGADDPAVASSASLIEAFAFASSGAQSRIESTVQAAAYADASASAIPSLFDHGADAPRRFRHTDILAHRAARARFTQQRSGATQTAESEEQRAAYLKLYSTVYASFEDLCAKKMPLAYLPYCNDMLKSYRFFAQGINYADRPEQICMNGNFCDHRAYVRRVTHNTYQREPGDA